MSIRAQVIGCFMALLLLFGGASINNFLRASRANERLELVNELFLPLSRIIVQLQGNSQGLAEDMRRYYSRTEATSETSSFSRMVRDLYPYLIHKKFEAADQLLQKHEASGSKPMIEELRQLLSHARASFDGFVAVVDKNRLEESFGDLRTTLKRVSVRLDDEAQRITLAAQAENQDNLVTSLIGTVLAVVFGVFTGWLSHRVLAPLPELISCIRRIADGDFNQSLKVKSSDKDEVSLLAREYNRMLSALGERDKKILKQQQELLQAERLAAVGQLSAEIVHEIRNPLNAISLNIDWLENELQSNHPEIKRTLASISKEIERLHLITESYLVRARMPATGEQKTGINDLINEILDFSKEEHKQRNIVVEKTLVDQEIFVRSDRSRLKQALLNIFRNAREAMPNGGQLRVSSRIQDNVLRVEVTDSGYGMNEATRRRTFNPFFTTKPNGTGLGLMLTKTIVEEAQGSVECDSEMGEGTTFTFKFPVDREIRTGEC
jgi:two-component system, NtrC family, sensor kinase